MKAVNQLQEKRDMSINECKLTIAIEDPRSRERREALGIEVRHNLDMHLCKCGMGLSAEAMHWAMVEAQYVMICNAAGISGVSVYNGMEACNLMFNFTCWCTCIICQEKLTLT